MVSYLRKKLSKHMKEQEMPLEMRIEISKQAHRENMEAFGLDKSSGFAGLFDRMKGMDHGPNHQEGDPAIHTQLVELAMNDFLRTQEHGLSEADQRLLRLATALHDVGKAETLQYDAISPKQNEMVGLPDEDVEAISGEIDDLLFHGELLARLTEYAPEEIDLKDEIIAAEGIAFANDQMSDKFKTTGELSNTDKERIKMVLLPILLRVPKTVFDKDKFPGFVANFRGHDDASAALVGPILDETGQDYSVGERDDLEFVVKQHMLLLEPEKLSFKKFKELFVKEDGGVDKRRIDLLRAHSYADNAGTVKKKAADGPPLIEKIDAVVGKLIAQHEAEKAKAEAAEKAAQLEASIFEDHDGKMSAYLAKKGLEGRAMGMGIGKIKGVMKRMEGQDPAAIRAEIDKLEF